MVEGTLRAKPSDQIKIHYAWRRKKSGGGNDFIDFHLNVSMTFLLLLPLEGPSRCASDNTEDTFFSSFSRSHESEKILQLLQTHKLPPTAEMLTYLNTQTHARPSQTYLPTQTPLHHNPKYTYSNHPPKLIHTRTDVAQRELIPHRKTTSE